jgi:hypothetical protein
MIKSLLQQQGKALITLQIDIVPGTKKNTLWQKQVILVLK